MELNSNYKLYPWLKTDMRVRKSLLILIIIAACLGAYFNTLFADFVWDDLNADGIQDALDVEHQHHRGLRRQRIGIHACIEYEEQADAAEGQTHDCQAHHRHQATRRLFPYHYH